MKRFMLLAGLLALALSAGPASAERRTSGERRTPRGRHATVESRSSEDTHPSTERHASAGRHRNSRRTPVLVPRGFPVHRAFPHVVVRAPRHRFADTPHAGLFPSEEMPHMDAWLSKPVDPSTLLRKVKELLN